MADRTLKKHKDTISPDNLLNRQDQTEFSKEFPLQISEVPARGLESFSTELPKNRDSETEVVHSQQPKDLPIPNLFFLRDDLLPLGLGTKWRKVQGILDFLKKNRMDKVLLWGAIHGNYLASFTYILRRNGIKVDAITYTRDPKLKTYNEQLVRGHTHSIECYASRKETYEVWLERQIDYSGLVLPEFGIHPGQIPGLQSLWEKLGKELEKNSLFLSTSKETPNQSKETLIKHRTSKNEIQTKQESTTVTAILILEIGSGATFLSAFDALHGSSLMVLGVMVGESKEKWIPKVANLQKQLGLKILSVPAEQILELPRIGEGGFPKSERDMGSGIIDSEMQPIHSAPWDSTNPNTLRKIITRPKKISSQFAKKNLALLEWIGRFYRYTNILLEPVYSGNTVNSILREIYEQQLVAKPRDSKESATKALDKQNPEGKNPMGENGNSKHVPNQFLKRTPSGEMIPIFYLHQGGQIQHLDSVLGEI